MVEWIDAVQHGEQLGAAAGRELYPRLCQHRGGLPSAEPHPTLNLTVVSSSRCRELWQQSQQKGTKYDEWKSY